MGKCKALFLKSKGAFQGRSEIAVGFIMDAEEQSRTTAQRLGRETWKYLSCLGSYVDTKLNVYFGKIKRYTTNPKAIANKQTHEKPRRSYRR